MTPHIWPLENAVNNIYITSVTLLTWRINRIMHVLSPDLLYEATLLRRNYSIAIFISFLPVWFNSMEYDASCLFYLTGVQLYRHFNTSLPHKLSLNMTTFMSVLIQKLHTILQVKILTMVYLSAHIKITIQSVTNGVKSMRVQASPYTCQSSNTPSLSSNFS